MENEKELPALFITDIEKKKNTGIIENIIIKETATFYLLDMPATCFSNEETGIEAIKQKNEKYIEVRIINFFFSHSYKF